MHGKRVNGQLERTIRAVNLIVVTLFVFPSLPFFLPRSLSQAFRLAALLAMRFAVVDNRELLIALAERSFESSVVVI